MKIPRIYADEMGHSYFDDTELKQTGDPRRRIQAATQDVEYWQIRQIKPGHVIDFKRAEAPQFVSVLAGNMALTVSNGETRFFSRGDMFVLQDVKGQGHLTKIVGHDTCTTLILTLKGNGDFK